MSNLSTFYTVETPNSNLLINGNVSICQRGATGTYNFEYSIDRWKSTFVEDGVAHRDHTLALGRDYIEAYKGNIVEFRCSLNSDRFTIKQRIESRNLNGYVGKNMTLSFYLGGGDITTESNIRIQVYEPSTTDDYTSNTIIYDEVIATLSAGDSDMVRYDYTFTVTNNMSNLGAQVGITISPDDTGYLSVSGTETAVRFGGIKLEEGNNVTEFIPRSYGEELTLCQRYCLSISGYTWAHSKDDASIHYETTLFPVTMRCAPSVLISNFNDVDSSGSTINNMLVRDFGIRTIAMDTTITIGNRFITDFLFEAEI